MAYELEGIEGKVVVVTGAGRGIGRTYAEALVEAGARVVAVDVSELACEDIRRMATPISDRLVTVVADVSNEAQTRAAAAAAVDAFGTIDVLVNNAAIYGGLPFANASVIDVERWERVLAVNVTGMWLMSKSVHPHMKRSGGGVIVNQSSVAAYLGGPNFADYCTSKGAANALTRCLARDFGPDGIRVNALAPGGIGTDATVDPWGGDDSAFRASSESKQIIKRPGAVEDLVGPLMFLISESSRFMTGQVLVIDGGWQLVG